MNKWTQKEKDFLEENYGEIERKEIASKLGRTVSSICWKAGQLDLREDKNQKWSAEEISTLKEKYSFVDTSELADQLGRTRQAVETKAKTHNLSKQEHHNIKKRLQRRGIREFDKTHRGSFFCGLIAGEGCFTSSKSEDKYEQFVFQVTMSQKDEELVRELNNFLGVGHTKVYSRSNPSHDDVVQYRINGVVDIVSTLIPFIEEHSLTSSFKEKQYLEWKEDIMTKYDITNEGIGDVE